MPNEGGTPRCDDAQEYAGNCQNHMRVVKIDFARQLERELNAARAELRQLQIDAVFATSLRKQVAVMGEKLEANQSELDKALTTLELCREGRDPGLRDQVKYHKAMATEYRGELSACQAELAEVRRKLIEDDNEITAMGGPT